MQPTRCTGFRVERDRAEVLAKDLKRALRFSCSAVYCEACDGYHVAYDKAKMHLDQRHQRILELVVAGMRDHEIALEMQMTTKTVSHAVDRLIRQLNALSRPNLAAIATALGFIDPTVFLPEIKPVKPG